MDHPSSMFFLLPSFQISHSALLQVVANVLITTTAPPSVICFAVVNVHVSYLLSVNLVGVNVAAVKSIIDRIISWGSAIVGIEIFVAVLFYF